MSAGRWSAIRAQAELRAEGVETAPTDDWLPKWERWRATCREQRRAAFRVAERCDETQPRAVAAATQQLLRAADACDVEAALIALREGADVDAPSGHEGATALHVACGAERAVDFPEGAGPVVALLLRAGADDRKKNNRRERPYSIAARAHDWHAMAALRAASFEASDTWALVKMRQLVLEGRATLQVGAESSDEGEAGFASDSALHVDSCAAAGSASASAAGPLPAGIGATPAPPPRGLEREYSEELAEGDAVAAKSLADADVDAKALEVWTEAAAAPPSSDSSTAAAGTRAVSTPPTMTAHDVLKAIPTPVFVDVLSLMGWTS